MNLITDVLNQISETIIKKVTNNESIINRKEDFVKVTTNEILEELNQDFDQYNKTMIKQVVSAFIEKIIENVSNKKKVVVTGFGTFEPRFQKGREGFNHATGLAFKSEDKYTPKFVASDKFKQKVANAN